MKNLSNIRFGRKSITIAFILLPVLLLAVYSFLQTREQLIKHIYEERRTLVSLSARVLDEKLDHLNDIGLSLATRPVFRKFIDEGKWDDAIDLMKEVPNDFPYISRVFITDTTGTVMADAPSITGIKNNNQASLDWYKGISKNWQPYLSEVYKRPENPQLVVTALALPVKNKTGRVRGTLVLQVNVAKLLEWSSSVSIGKSGFVYIVDRKGHIAADPDYAKSDTVIDYSSVPAVQKALKGETNVEILYNPLAKENLLYAYEQVPAYGWAVIVQQEANAALSVNNSLRSVLIFYSFIILLASALAWLVIREINHRKQSEKELSKYVELVEDTHVVIRNMNDEIIFWNKGMEKLYGWDREEVIGRTTHNLFSTQFPQPLPEIDNSLLKNNEWHGELRHTIKDGSILYVSSHWHLHRDKHGEPLAILETNNDITDLKKAQENLRKSEESNRLLIANVRDYAIFMLDTNGLVASWNSGAERIKGYKENEIIGKSFEVFYSEEDRRNGEPFYNLEMAKQDGHYEKEGWRLRKDGSSFWANVIFTALKDDAGNLYGYSKITRDITERKKAQEQLEFLSLQINQSNDAIYTLDADQKIKNWNHGAENLYGFSKDEALGKDSNELLKTAITKDEVSAAIKVIAEQVYWAGEVKRITKSGNDIYVRASTTTIKDVNGAIAGYVAVSFDVTNEKKLREQVNHLATMVDHSTEAIITRRLDKQIISWNKGAEKLFGYSKEEAIGKLVSELRFIQLTDKEISAVEQQVSETGIWKTEMNFFHRDGSSLFGTVTANGVKNEQGETTAIIFIIRDISKRKFLEDELKKLNEELEAKVQARTEEIYKNEKRFRALIENSNDIISLMDGSFKIVYRSPAGARVSGRTNEEMEVPDIAQNIIHPDDKEKVANTLKEIMANPGKHMNTGYRILHKNGHYIWTEGTIINLLHEEEIKGIVFNFRDVTERIEAEEKLRSSEEKYRTLIQRITDAVIAVDKNWCYTYLNKQAGELIHRNPADLIGKNVWEVFPDAVGSATYEAFNKAMKDQHYIYNLDYYEPLDLWQENHIYPSQEGLSVFIRDITEKKKLEIKLQEQQRKEQLKITAAWLQAQEKERNTIAQELHDNVNQILAGTNLYLSIAKINPEKSREHIESSMINIQSAIAENRKIAHVLVTPDFETIKLTDLIQNLLDKMLNPSGIDAHIDTADLKEDCLNDEQRLAIYRITQEQCTNIIKYAKAQHVIIIISTTNGIFKMSIADNGKGMELNKVTAGIGLRNIKSRAVILNGEVNIITSPGNGFTLEIRMPYET